MFLCQRFRVKIPVYFSCNLLITLVNYTRYSELNFMVHLSGAIWDPSFCSVPTQSILYSLVPLDGLVQTMPDSSPMQHGIFL